MTMGFFVFQIGYVSGVVIISTDVVLDKQLALNIDSSIVCDAAVDAATAVCCTTTAGLPAVAPPAADGVAADAVAVADVDDACTPVADGLHKVGPVTRNVLPTGSSARHVKCIRTTRPVGK